MPGVDARPGRSRRVAAGLCEMRRTWSSLQSALSPSNLCLGRRRGCGGTFPRRGTHGTLFLPMLTVASVSRVQGSRCELPESTSGPVWSSVNYQSRRCQSVPACALKSASNTISGRTERRSALVPCRAFWYAGRTTVMVHVLASVEHGILGFCEVHVRVYTPAHPRPHI